MRKKVKKALPKTKKKSKNMILLKSSFKKERGWEAAKNSRLNFGWKSSLENINQKISEQLNTLKARARDAQQNDAVVNSYLSTCIKNTIGSEGIQLKMKATDNGGTLDTYANQIIEKAWLEFSKSPTVSDDLSLKDVLKLIHQQERLDGEAIVIMHEGIGNAWNFGIEIIDSTYLDATYNEVLDSGNKIICGIELNSWGKPVNYYFKTPPSTLSAYALDNTDRKKIPARNVLHLYTKLIPSAVRGVPPIAPVLGDIKTLNDYIEAELMAAKLGAAKMGWIVDGENAPYVPDSDTNGDAIDVVEPGTIGHLQAGQQFQSFLPEHPTTQFPEFVKMILKRVSACLGLSYNTLINDFSDANYSNMRAASLSDRETFKVMQDELIETILQPMFERFLFIQLANKNINLPVTKFDEFKAANWIPRRWDWVDPLKDIQASKVELELGLTSKARILAEKGLDYEEIKAEIAKEEPIKIEEKVDPNNDKPKDI